MSGVTRNLRMHVLRRLNGRCGLQCSPLHVDYINDMIWEGLADHIADLKTRPGEPLCQAYRVNFNDEAGNVADVAVVFDIRAGAAKSVFPYDEVRISDRGHLIWLGED